MARYLIVAHQTAGSPELLERVRARAALCSPCWSRPPPTGRLLHNWEEGEAGQLARRRAGEAMASLAEAGPGVRGPGGQPLAPGGGRRQAQAHPGYDRIVLSTFPRGCRAGSKGNLRAMPRAPV